MCTAFVQFGSLGGALWGLGCWRRSPTPLGPPIRRFHLAVQVSTAEVKLTATRTEYQTLSQKFDDLLGRYTEYKNK